MHFYSLVSHGYHLSALVNHLFFVERMNDFEEMILHDLSTNALLCSSNYGCCHRFGSIVLWLHDVSDIFVAIAKMFNATGNDMACVFAGYIPMCVAWLWFRMLYLPYIVFGIVIVSPSY